MAILMDKVARNLSQNVISLRNKRRLSQASLAKLAGVKRSSVTVIESGSANPTLAMLMKLSLALQISIDELLSPPTVECKHILAKDVPIAKKSKNGVILRKLLPDKIPATEIDEINLEKGSVLIGVPHVEGTKEYFTCIYGKIIIRVLEHQYLLQKGDVLVFPGGMPHSYKNAGTKKAQGISVVFFNTST